MKGQLGQQNMQKNDRPKHFEAETVVFKKDPGQSQPRSWPVLSLFVTSMPIVPEKLRSSNWFSF